MEELKVYSDFLSTAQLLSSKPEFNVKFVGVDSVFRLSEVSDIKPELLSRIGLPICRIVDKFTQDTSFSISFHTPTHYRSLPKLSIKTQGDWGLHFKRQEVWIMEHLQDLMDYLDVDNPLQIPSPKSVRTGIVSAYNPKVIGRLALRDPPVAYRPDGGDESMPASRLIFGGQSHARRMVEGVAGDFQKSGRGSGVTYINTKVSVPFDDSGNNSLIELLDDDLVDLATQTGRKFNRSDLMILLPFTNSFVKSKFKKANNKFSNFASMGGTKCGHLREPSKISVDLESRARDELQNTLDGLAEQHPDLPIIVLAVIPRHLSSCCEDCKKQSPSAPEDCNNIRKDFNEKVIKTACDNTNNINVRYMDLFDFEKTEMSRISEKFYANKDLVHLNDDTYLTMTDTILAYYIQEYGAVSNVEEQSSEAAEEDLDDDLEDQMSAIINEQV